MQTSYNDPMMNKNEIEALFEKASFACHNLDENALCDDLATELFNLADACELPLDLTTELLDDMMIAVASDLPIEAHDSFQELRNLIRAAI